MKSLSIKTRKGTVRINLDNKGQFIFTLPSGFNGSNLNSFRRRHEASLQSYKEENLSETSIIEEDVEIREASPLTEAETFADFKERLEEGKTVEFPSSELFRRFVKTFNLQFSMFIEDRNFKILKPHFRTL